MIVTIVTDKARDLYIPPSARVARLLSTLSEIDETDWTRSQIKVERTGDVLGENDSLAGHRVTDGDTLYILRKAD